MPNWLEKHVDKVLAMLGLDSRDVAAVWFSQRNPKRVVLTVVPEGKSAKRVSIPIPQAKG